MRNVYENKSQAKTKVEKQKSGIMPYSDQKNYQNLLLMKVLLRKSAKRSAFSRNQFRMQGLTVDRKHKQVKTKDANTELKTDTVCCPKVSVQL